MHLAIVISSNDPETVWNAFRLGNSALAVGDGVTVFLLGKGVECVTLRSFRHDVAEQIELFRGTGGTLIGCGVCCESRAETMPYLKDDLQCEMGSMQTRAQLIRESDRLLSF